MIGIPSSAHSLYGRVSMLTTPRVSSTEVQENYASFHQPKSAARQTQPHYQDLVRLLDAIVWRADAVTLEITYISERAKLILGYPLSQWRQPAFQETHLHPEDRLKVLACYREAIRDGEKHRLDYRMTAADGRAIWFH